jgi:hypothetical protein
MGEKSEEIMRKKRGIERSKSKKRGGREKDDWERKDRNVRTYR